MKLTAYERKIQETLEANRQSFLKRHAIYCHGPSCQLCHPRPAPPDTLYLDDEWPADYQTVAAAESSQAPFDAGASFADLIAVAERFREGRRGALRTKQPTLEDLAEDLAGRAPVFILESNIPKGSVWWLTDSLPLVFLAPDVYRSILDRDRNRLIDEARD